MKKYLLPSVAALCAFLLLGFVALTLLKAPSSEKSSTRPLSSLFALLEEQLTQLEKQQRTITAQFKEMTEAAQKIERWRYAPAKEELEELKAGLTRILEPKPVAQQGLGFGESDSRLFMESARSWDEAIVQLRTLVPQPTRTYNYGESPEPAEYEFSRALNVAFWESPELQSCRGYGRPMGLNEGYDPSYPPPPPVGRFAEDPRHLANSCLGVVEQLLREGSFNAVQSGVLQVVRREVERLKTTSEALENDIKKKREQIDTATDGLRRDSSLDTLIKAGLPAIALLLLFLFVVTRTFPERVQELIMDGRLLLDLSTVVLLVAAILVLGLAERIESEVLGTLIGGISGYVLSRSRFGGPGESHPLPTPRPGRAEEMKHLAPENVAPVVPAPAE